MKADKIRSEFDLLISSGKNLPINDMDSELHSLSQVLEKKIASAVNDVVASKLTQNQGKPVQIVLQNIVSQIPSTVLVRYNRAGKNYITIDHTMGHLGNLFFDAVFANLAKDNLIQNPHTIIQENKICFVFRQ